MATEGDAMSLISPELFVSDAARTAFSRIAAHQGRDKHAVIPDASATADDVSPSLDDPDDNVRALLEAAAAGGEKLSSAAVLGRVADELRHFVAESIRQIGEGADVPFAVLSPDASVAERYHHRRGWLRWLSEREIELRDPRLQAGAAPVVANWIRGGFEAETTHPTEP